MSGRTYHILVERDEDGLFGASVPELPACHTQGRSKSEVALRIREAIEAYLKAGRPPSRGPTFVEVQTIEV